jgi:pantoate--beta-alanine ligase
MIILKTPSELRAWRQTLKPGTTVGFAPTMGALHAGHLRLMQESRASNDVTVASIFVNPLQFGPKEDFSRYPRPFDEDARLLQEAGVEVLFSPNTNDFYEKDHSTYCDVLGLDQHLCGASRPHHFRGVCTVVLKLFNLVQCHRAYFGQKDIQQALILRRMVRDLALPLEMHIVETVREASGLAMSSRNRYLSDGEGERATALYRGLNGASQAHAAGERDAEKLKDQIRREVLAAYPTRIDYIEAVDQATLTPQSQLDMPAVLAVAVFFGKTRLIDNVILY